MATYLRDIEAALDTELAILLGVDATLETPAKIPNRANDSWWLHDSEETSAGKQPFTRGSEAVRSGAELRQVSDRVYRLEQLKRWLREDPDMFHALDITIRSKVVGAELRQHDLDLAAARRQRTLAIMASILTLFAGWLLSLIGTPATFAQLFGR